MKRVIQGSSPIIFVLEEWKGLKSFKLMICENNEVLRERK